ncbi:MAG: 1-deoxy-D-xylulose-5-phosphate reductoisomerase [Pseudomonadota bacterium]|nr:1-deoxy-D-xylulose-5-phosphate reductoisomerase [Pseudomonadota bacterium]
MSDHNNFFEKVRRVSVLGATGSVGKSTVELIESNRDFYDVQALTANNNVKLLADQARRLDASFVAIANPEKYNELKSEVSGVGIEIAAGPESIVEAAARDTDWVMAAIVGAAGLKPTIQAVKNAAVVALANKECLVCAGGLMLDEVIKSGCTLLPVDSEHNAIFQVFNFDNREEIEKIILTASGGPFWLKSYEEMSGVTPTEAIAHPNWDMGDKISIDSATMMNKGLELIEAHFLFGLPETKIEVLVHPQSIIHSMVEYIDGSILAQLGSPDMRIPISYTLAWPRRMEIQKRNLKLEEIGTLTFEPPDTQKFPALMLAREALKIGNSAPVALNAANEEAVAAFLCGKVSFTDIAKIVDQILERTSFKKIESIGDVLSIDDIARRLAQDKVADLTVQV